MTSKLVRLVGVCFIAGSVMACQHTGERIILSSKPAVELRAIQSRAFDTTDKLKMMRTIVSTLQDLGYKIDKVEPGAGSVSATKLSFLHLTASVYPRGTSQLMVRANAQVKTQQQTENQVDDPEFYQKFFFEPLSKAIFLTALQVEDGLEGEVMEQAPATKPDGSKDPSDSP